jgi:hypothetical protein
MPTWLSSVRGEIKWLNQCRLSVTSEPSQQLGDRASIPAIKLGIFGLVHHSRHSHGEEAFQLYMQTLHLINQRGMQHAWHMWLESLKEDTARKTQT